MYDRLWEYDPSASQYYCYEDGYWKLDENKNVFSLEKSISRILRNIDIKWDKSYKISEVKKAIKFCISDEKNKEKFNPGKSPDLKHINVKNGMLDWKDKNLKPHSHEYYSIFQLNVDYEPEANCTKWLKCLDDWLPDNKTKLFLQEFVGYMLIPDTKHHKAVFLYGTGSNGKNTFLNVLIELFGGNNINSLSLSRLTNKNERRWSTNYLKDKLCNICSDVDNQYIKSTGTLKRMIAGEKINAEIKNGANYNYDSITRFIFSANELPKSKDKSNGWYRRLEFVEFPNSFFPSQKDFDKNLEKKLMLELPGIFNWALEGLRRLDNNGSFTISESMKKSKLQYKYDNDIVKYFLKENVIKTDGHKEDYIIKREMYRDFIDWAEEYELKNTFSKKKLTNHFKRLGILDGSKFIDGKTERVYFGLKRK